MEPHEFRSIPLEALINVWANQTNKNAPRTVSLALSTTCAIATKNVCCAVKDMHKFLCKQVPTRSLNKSEVILSQQCSLAVPTTSTGMCTGQLPLLSQGRLIYSKHILNTLGRCAGKSFGYVLANKQAK